MTPWERQERRENRIAWLIVVGLFAWLFIALKPEPRPHDVAQPLMIVSAQLRAPDTNAPSDLDAPGQFALDHQQKVGSK